MVAWWAWDNDSCSGCGSLQPFGLAHCIARVEATTSAAEVARCIGLDSYVAAPAPGDAEAQPHSLELVIRSYSDDTNSWRVVATMVVPHDLRVEKFIAWFRRAFAQANVKSFSGRRGADQERALRAADPYRPSLFMDCEPAR